ncbi:MAG: hypothetical protein O3B65_00280 [Chloroflexi bacterium]|nr:hypothetical protein [Chloroflexota bacterium]
MLERKELTGVLFATGLVLVVVGMVGVGGAQALDWAIGVAGMLIAVLAGAWWPILRTHQ